MNGESFPVCPVPDDDSETVLLAHGGGGRLMHQLLERVVVPAFGNPRLDARHDGAVLSFGPSRVAFTTDTFVVYPHVFPGGDIGSLAVFGTVNDLAMCGARPLWMSAGLILEEGFPFESLRCILASMRDAARSTGVEIVTGDTKVVDRGKGDGIFINTTGLGLVERDPPIAPGRVEPGDAVIVSGDLGRHGIAVMAQREGLAFETIIESDAAPLQGPVLRLLEEGVDIHCLRDLTRGGLASALVEIAEARNVRIEIHELEIPVSEGVRCACEMLGLDPLHVANEGRFVAFVPEAEERRTLEILEEEKVSEGARVIGRVQEAEAGRVALKTSLGTTRVVEMFSGEQLPRIC